VLRMAKENSTWGYTRIRGALFNLGHDIGRNTIKRILLEAGLEPAPERGKRTSWSDFLRAHWCAIAAMDFFKVEVVTWTGLVRFHVLFVIDLATRRVEIAGITDQPHEAWMKQQARNLTDAVDGFLLKHSYVIMDRDPLFCHSFRHMLKNSGVKPVRLPPRSPNLNAYAERWIGSVRRECLARVIPLGERHLRQIVQQYVAHYHQERNHQSLGNKLIAPMNDNAANGGCVVRSQRLGGVLSYYHRKAASASLEGCHRTGIRIRLRSPLDATHVTRLGRRPDECAQGCSSSRPHALADQASQYWLTRWAGHFSLASARLNRYFRGYVV